MKKLAVLLALLALAPFALAACGGDDDDGVEAEAPAEPAPANPLPAEGVAQDFEEDLAGWESHGGSIIEQTTEEAYSGERSLQVVTPGSSRSEGATTVELPANPNTAYNAGAWVRGPRGASLRLTLMERMADGSHEVTDQGFVGTGDWQQVTVERAFGEIAESAQLYVRTAETQAITFHVDDVELRAE